MARPSCVVRVADVPAEQRPRRLAAKDVRSEVRELSKLAGLTRMGVSLRSMQPGFASTNRHFHMVEEEWSYVLSGAGTVRIGPHRIGVRAGHFVAFPPGGGAHHFLAAGSEPLVILEGGERRKGEESVWYPDLGAVFRNEQIEKTAEMPAGAEAQGDPAQCLHIDDAKPFDFQHEVDPRARRVLKTLHTPSGLTRQAVRWSRVAAGDRSTAYHTHDRTDEWVYILEGRTRVRVADAWFEAAAGDFLGHPAGGASHVMEPITDLVYLMGGQIDPDDIVTYPDAGVQRRQGLIEPT